MVTVRISDLKNRLSEYLRKVRAGETVIVLDRNRPIARIERIAATAGKEAEDARIARLEAAGLITRPTAPMPLDLLRKPGPKSKRSVVEALLEERYEDDD